MRFPQNSGEHDVRRNRLHIIEFWSTSGAQRYCCGPATEASSNANEAISLLQTAQGAVQQQLDGAQTPQEAGHLEKPSDWVGLKV